MNVKHLYEGDKLTDKEQSELNLLANKIKKGNVILFLGAAVHCAPPDKFESFYPSTDRPPLGKDLANELAKELPKNDVKDKNLSWIAQYYEAAMQSRMELIKSIYDILLHKKPSPLVYALACMNFRLILTTNYDNLYEEALIEAGKKINNKGIYKPNKDIRNNNSKPFVPKPTT